LSDISKTEPKASAFAPAKIWPETQEAAVPVRVFCSIKREDRTD